MSSLLDEVALYLESQGLGSYTDDATRDLYTFKMPEDGGLVVCIYTYPGEPSVRMLCKQPVAERPRIQVRVRGATRSDDQLCYDRAYAIFRCLDSVADAVLSGTRYMHIQALQPPFELLRDENERLHMANDYAVQRQITGLNIVAAAGLAAGQAT